MDLQLLGGICSALLREPYGKAQPTQNQDIFQHNSGTFTAVAGWYHEGAQVPGRLRVQRLHDGVEQARPWWRTHTAHTPHTHARMRTPRACTPC